MMSQLPLLRAAVTLFSVLSVPATVLGQSDTRYTAPPPVASKPTSAPNNNSLQQPRTSHRAIIGQAYTARSPNPITSQQARAQVPYIGRSSFGNPSTPGTSIGLGVRRLSSPKPFSSVSASPTVSSYLNLFREGLGESDDFSYQTLVRPQLQQQQLNQQFQQQAFDLSRRLQSISAQGAYKNPAGAESLPPTGHQTAFGIHSHFYPSAAP